MKNSALEKLKLMKREVHAGRAVRVRIDGLAEEFTVAEIHERQFTVELQLDRNNGRLVVDPDDILAVRLLKAI